MRKIIDWLEKNEVKGGLFPTVFDLKEMWDVNSKRCNGKFNIYFFPFMPIMFLFCIPYTFLCLLEALLTTNE